MIINGTINIGKKDYFLNYDINTLCMMKGQGIDVMKLQQIEMDIVIIRDLFYFGLKKLQKGLSREDAGDLMSEFMQEGNTFEDLANIITSALTKSLGVKVDEEEGK